MSLFSTGGSRFAVPITRASLLVLALFSGFVAPASALSLNVSDDAYVGPGGRDDGGERDDHGSGPRQKRVVRIGNSGGSTRAGFVRFDLAPLPTTTKVTSAFLRVFVQEVRKPGMIAIHEVASAWSESSLTNPPTPGAAVTTFTVGAADLGRYVAVDVTKAVNDWLSGTQNFGLGFSVASGGQAEVAFDSKENAVTSHPMELEVAFEGPQGPQGIQGIPGIKGDKGDKGDQGPPGPGVVLAGKNCPAGQFVSGFGPDGLPICAGPGGGGCAPFTVTLKARALSNGVPIFPVQQWERGSITSRPSADCSVRVSQPEGLIDGTGPVKTGWVIDAVTGFRSCTQLVQQPNCTAPAAIARIDGGTFPACSSGAVTLDGRFSTAENVISCAP